MKYDLVIFGGGTSGIAAAYTAAKLGINCLLVEKSDVLGGSITQGLVVPTMKVNSCDINTDFYNDLLSFSKKYNAQYTYTDGNTGWFNPELLKIVFDKMIKSVNCSVLFDSEPISGSYTDNEFHFEIKNKMLSLHIDTDYFIDATSNAEIFRLLNLKLQDNSKEKQAPSLRFMISNVYLTDFADWILSIDKNEDVTTVDYSGDKVHLSTACTWDSAKNWALTPYFLKAVADGVLESNDTAYFQIFTVPNMQGTVAVNAPRIILDDNEDILSPFIYSKALIQGRERIYRLHNFCKKYLIGFENSYISHISDMLGIRESYRIKGKYTYTKEDFVSQKCFDNIAFACDYPIDIHSNNTSKDKLINQKKCCYVPLEVLISADNDKAYAVGRILSADFEAQSALRTQMSCFSMGEAAAKDIFKKLNPNKMQ
ncbi:FAD-dependent oxidoreductase [bacterium]|nr:FAD-dependent oxidoreductase [bacterium]